MILDLPIPPKELRFMAETEAQYLEIGDALVRQIDQLVDLGTRPRIVDIGCGYGRLAHALLRSSRFIGRYFGFDVLARHITWCETQLTPASAGRCRFRHADVHNDRYNPTGTIAPDAVTFDLPDASADLIVLTSVFTHMHPTEVQHYLHEIARLVAPTGRAYVTFFLLDAAVDRALAAGTTHYSLPHRLTSFCRCMDLNDPLHVIAYDETWVREQIAAAGLRVDEPVRHGGWAGRREAFDFQDTLVLAKREVGSQRPG